MFFNKVNILGDNVLHIEPKNKDAKLLPQIGSRIHLLKFVAH
jgi:hypothetical protein